MSYKPKTYEESIMQQMIFNLQGQQRYEIRMIAHQADIEVDKLKKEIARLKMELNNGNEEK
jgi:hypothetical protein